MLYVCDLLQCASYVFELNLDDKYTLSRRTREFSTLVMDSANTLDTGNDRSWCEQKNIFSVEESLLRGLFTQEQQ